MAPAGRPHRPRRSQQREPDRRAGHRGDPAAAPQIDENLRAATARAVAALPLPLALLEMFASDRLAVCAPVLASASLDDVQWRALLAVADAETSRFIETLHPELRPEPAIGSGEALEPAPPRRTGSRPTPATPDEPLDLTEPYVEAPEQAAPTEHGQALHELVERIERRQRDRRAKQKSAAAKAPAPGASSLFRWECGPSGEIAWVEGAPRGPLIGRSLARPEESAGNRVDPEVVRAFSLRAPFRDAMLTVAGDGPVAGEWQISGLPAFEPADGRFAGYRGVALRETRRRAAAAKAAKTCYRPGFAARAGPEIKTPLNAIIGFAEIIDGQFLGPADHRYRERAGEIVGQARLLLTAIDDLDFAAKIHSSRARRAAPRELGAAGRTDGSVAARACRHPRRRAGLFAHCAALPALSSPKSPTGCSSASLNAMIERAGARRAFAAVGRQRARPLPRVDHAGRRRSRGWRRRAVRIAAKPSGALGEASRCAWCAGWRGSPAPTWQSPGPPYRWSSRGLTWRRAPAAIAAGRGGPVAQR